MLRRLFDKNPDSFAVANLYSKMSQPLFVHPELGESVVRSYFELFKSSDMLSPIMDNMSSGTFMQDGIAVLDISGALVAREEATPCGQSPVSYEGLKAEISDLLINEEIHTVVARIDSPGGMAAQNMDLSDFIFSSRGQGTKLIAMVDDMAYSAAYGIASAFEEIWVTRTGGVGSVGVVSYHVDQSEANAKAGVKIEYVYAGNKKVQGNPNEPLSEEGRIEQQNEVDRLYNIFTATVARNLGLSIDDVKATEAGTFHGEEAIKVGFAHKLGTFDELLSSLLSNDLDEIEDAEFSLLDEKEGIDLEVEKSFVSLEKTPKSEIAEQALENNETNLIKSRLEDLDKDTIQEILNLIKEEQEQVKKESEQFKEYVTEVNAICMAADVPAQAQKFIEEELQIEQIREKVLELTSNENVEIESSTSVAVVNSNAKSSSHYSDIYAKRKAQCNI